VKYKTVVEIITDADNEDEAVDLAGEYLRGKYECTFPLKVKTHQLKKRNYRVLAYSGAAYLIVLSLSFMWFSAGRTYQTIVSAKHNDMLDGCAIQPPLNTDLNHKAGKDFKESWDKLYRKKALHSPDNNISSN